MKESVAIIVYQSLLILTDWNFDKNWRSDATIVCFSICYRLNSLIMIWGWFRATVIILHILHASSSVNTLIYSLSQLITQMSELLSRQSFRLCNSWRQMTWWMCCHIVGVFCLLNFIERAWITSITEFVFFARLPTGLRVQQTLVMVYIGWKCSFKSQHGFIEWKLLQPRAL